MGGCRLILTMLMVPRDKSETIRATNLQVGARVGETCESVAREVKVSQRDPPYPYMHRVTD